MHGCFGQRRPSAGSLSSVYTSEHFLSQFCTTFPVVPAVLSVKRELLPAEAVSLFVNFFAFVLMYPILYTCILQNISFPVFLTAVCVY